MMRSVWVVALVDRGRRACGGQGVMGRVTGDRGVQGGFRVEGKTSTYKYTAWIITLVHSSMQFRLLSSSRY